MARLYLRCDFFIGHEYRGLIASCPNEGEDFYRVPYTPESLKELKDLRIECSYGVSDLSPEEAILQLMMGKPRRSMRWKGRNCSRKPGRFMI